MTQTAKVLPCGHIFHAPCLGAWLQTSGQQKFTCPICRANLATADDDDSSGTAARHSETGRDPAEGHTAPRMTRAVSQVRERVGPKNGPRSISCLLLTLPALSFAHGYTGQQCKLRPVRTHIHANLR